MKVNRLMGVAVGLMLAMGLVIGITPQLASADDGVSAVNSDLIVSAQDGKTDKSDQPVLDNETGSELTDGLNETLTTELSYMTIGSSGYIPSDDDVFVFNVIVACMALVGIVAVVIYLKKDQQKVEQANALLNADKVEKKQ
ncbi:MAG: hypothetical protein LBU61_02760 [Coriobacteriales bacterium]|jgi:hypothetical protein|nr:hypothetical protein [Coriobacteriales bacterium]